MQQSTTISSVRDLFSFRFKIPGRLAMIVLELISTRMSQAGQCRVIASKRHAKPRRTAFGWPRRFAYSPSPDGPAVDGTRADGSCCAARCAFAGLQQVVDIPIIFCSRSVWCRARAQEQVRADQTSKRTGGAHCCAPPGRAEKS